MIRHVLLVALLASCYRDAKDPALEARVAKLEQRVAEQDRQLAAARSGDTASVEAAALAAQIDALNGKLDTLLGMGGGQPARPPRREPDHSKVYAVPVGSSAVEGPATAKVTMVMAFDFWCPYCRRSWDTVTGLEKKYGSNLRVVYKHLVVHPTTAQYQAQAACAANRQKKFRPMVELLWKAFDDRDNEPSHIDALAKQAKLDMKRYKADVASCADEIKDDAALMRKLGASATPSFWINGRFSEGARDQSAFEEAIDAAIVEADKAIAAGTPADKVYDTQVMAKGLTEVP